MNLEFIKPQNLGSLLMKSRQSNFELQLPGSYLIAAVWMEETLDKILSFDHIGNSILK